ncbi:MAG: DUF2334 domain-containing protein [Desulfobia sp.]
MRRVILPLLLVIALFTNANAVLCTDELPALIIVYDDGHIQDLTQALPVHQKMNAPAVSSINPDTLGNKGRLKRRHLHMLELWGWEIASHGLYHAHLGKNKIKNRIKKGSTIVEISNAHLIEKRYRYSLYDPNTNTKEEFDVEDIIIDDDKHYIQVKNPLLFNHTKDAYVTLTKNSMQKEIYGSKEILREMGFRVTSFVFPYNGYTEQAKNIVRKHYLFARVGQRKGCDFPKAFINTSPMKCRTLHAACFENELITDEDLHELLKRTVQEHSLLILYAHSGKESFSVKRLENIIQTARDLGLNITTFQKLMADSAFFCR